MCRGSRGMANATGTGSARGGRLPRRLQGRWSQSRLGGSVFWGQRGRVWVSRLTDKAGQAGGAPEGAVTSPRRGPQGHCPQDQPRVTQHHRPRRGGHDRPPARCGGSPCPPPAVTGGRRGPLPAKGASGDGAGTSRSPAVPRHEASRLLLVNGDVGGHGTVGLGVLLPETRHLLPGRRCHRDDTVREEEGGDVGGGGQRFTPGSSSPDSTPVTCWRQLEAGPGIPAAPPKSGPEPPGSASHNAGNARPALCCHRHGTKPRAGNSVLSRSRCNYTPGPN